MSIDGVIASVKRWRAARRVVLDASIYPIGNEAYRIALNELSEAESELYEADCIKSDEPCRS